MTTKVFKLANKLTLKYAAKPEDYFDLAKDLSNPSEPFSIVDDPELDVESIGKTVDLESLKRYVEAITRIVNEVSSKLENPSLDAKFPAATAVEAQRLVTEAYYLLKELRTLMVDRRGKL